MKKIGIILIVIIALTSCTNKFEKRTLYYEFDEDDATPVGYDDGKVYFVLDNYSNTYTSFSTSSLGYYDLELEEYIELFNLKNDFDRVWDFVEYDGSLLYTRLIQENSEAVPIYEITYQNNDIDRVIYSGKAYSYGAIPSLTFGMNPSIVYFISQRTFDSEEACLFSFDMTNEWSQSLVCYPTTRVDDSVPIEIISSTNLSINDDSITFVTHLSTSSIIHEYDVKESSHRKYPQPHLVSEALALNNNLYFEYVEDGWFVSKVVSKTDHSESSLPSSFHRFSIEDNVVYFTPDDGDVVSSYNDSNGVTQDYAGYDRSLVENSFPFVYKDEHIISVNILKLGRIVIQIFD